MGNVNEPPIRRGSRKAYDEGVAAREAGSGEDACPYSQDARPQRRAWLEGYHSGGPELRTATPPVRNNTPTALVPGLHYVPEGEPLAVEYRQPQPVPCPKCRRLRLDSGSQACVCAGTWDGVAYMHCRNCDERFKAPIR